MPLIDKPLDSISEQDLLALISNQIREDKRIEFKAVVPGNSDRQRKEFLADVSSFANASGGDLIFGMEAQGGVASRLVGLELTSLDADILRLESILQDGLDPRIPNTKIKGISLTVGAALIVRVPRSWMPPHRVKYGGTSRFYSRNSAGKYELEVSEMRPLFALSASATETDSEL
jgi:predicted HTH transcriptional regulator